MLEALYPEHAWEMWRFDKVPNKFWDKQPNQRKYLEWMMRELQLRGMDSWYFVTAGVLEAFNQ
jgi:hypothetical protein